ncbi:hypothetical protein FSARC_1708 [Fusarium sarcochroum]|uniref:Uncharacterized protein n=1 Tax=Fusarium sarcochroum TaxID=1208366 RepID=A0A8H4XEJ4_9HYPO|nr:hypothetical protein FSARC_1708 [Fusarium sarcochroum]
MSLSAASLHQLHLIHEQGSSEYVADTQTTITYAYKSQAISSYTRAIKALSIADLEDSDAAGLYLAATLLLSLFEWDFGSAGSYFIHLNGADTLVSLRFENISKLPWGPAILQSWARMHHTRLTRQLPFRPLEKEKPPSHHKIAQLSNQVLDGSSILSVLVADAFSLRNRLILQKCFEGIEHGNQSVLQFWREWYSKVLGFPYVSETQSHGMKELDKSELLNGLFEDYDRLYKWRQSIPTAAEPIMLQTQPSDDLDSRNSALLHTTSWVFPKDGDALQYLGYLMGRILSSREILNLYLLGDLIPSPTLPLHPLVRDAFTVIEALDPETTIAHDTYGNGPLWIFGELSTCVPDLRVVSYLLYTVMPRFRRFASCGPLLETITKECQIIACVKSELERGRLTFLCDPDVILTDDFSLDEGSSVYTKLAVIGRDERGFYRDLIDVDRGNEF